MSVTMRYRIAPTSRSATGYREIRLQSVTAGASVLGRVWSSGDVRSVSFNQGPRDSHLTRRDRKAAQAELCWRYQGVAVRARDDLARSTSRPGSRLVSAAGSSLPVRWRKTSPGLHRAPGRRIAGPASRDRRRDSGLRRARRLHLLDLWSVPRGPGSTKPRCSPGCGRSRMSAVTSTRGRSVGPRRVASVENAEYVAPELPSRAERGGFPSVSRRRGAG